LGYLTSTYNPWGVMASVLIASFASYVALDLARRVRATDRREALVWWIGGSVALGTGIWAMHFVGMLAFVLPIPLGYTRLLTLASWLAAVGASGVALWAAGRGGLTLRRLAASAGIMGGAICAMHYIGMAALDMSPAIVWEPMLIVASAIVAVGASAAALLIFSWLRSVDGRQAALFQATAALLMGLAISGMHYTGMAAAQFPVNTVCLSAGALGGAGLGQLVVMAAVLVLSFTLFSSLVDARLRQRSQRETRKLTAANEELRSANEEARVRFAAVFEHAPMGYLLFDRERGIGLCNPAALRLFAADAGIALAGRSLWDPPLAPLHQPDGRSSRELALQQMQLQAEAGARVRSFELRLLRLDGTPFDANVAVIALELKAETTLAESASEPATEREFCAVIEDVTSRKQAEAAMKLARDAAESASQTKSNFLANMSHELRTPMNAIIGLTHLVLEDGELPSRQHDYVAKAHRSARDLLQILNDILDISKIEAGHVELERVDFELEAVVGEMNDVLGLKAEEKGLELLFSASPELPLRLIGDPMRLRQVLVNLGSNAIKFTDRGEVTVGVELQSQDAHSVELHAWVRDTGVGMTPDQLARVFQPFIQADSSTTRRFGGTGLGLSIARQLVESMGGRMWADSEPERGSTFHFTARFGRSATRAAPARALSAAELRGRRALLADDNAAALEVLGLMLEGLGITVDRATSGDEALRHIERSPDAYSWIVLDWKMPGLDGVACARRIVERFPQAQPCILLVTAFSRDDALRASTGLPLGGVLQKPVTPSTLCDCLMQTSSAAPTRRSAGPSGQTAELRKRLAGARVLLVEDQPLNRELAMELLRRAGVDVVVAGDGLEALNCLQDQGRFDGVLMDCQMPVMDGYTATRRLRENPAWRDLPVIAMTASALAADRERALASGMNAHIAKPLDVEQMLQTMVEWIVPSHAPKYDEASGVTTDWSPSGVGGPIDTEKGLLRCAGDTALYRRILVGFRQTQAGLADQWPSLDTAQAADEFRQYLHDLQGLAGTIGAVSLQVAAAALHQRLKAGDLAAAQAGRARIAAELGDVLGEIDRMVPAASA